MWKGIGKERDTYTFLIKLWVLISTQAEREHKGILQLEIAIVGTACLFSRCGRIELIFSHSKKKPASGLKCCGRFRLLVVSRPFFLVNLFSHRPDSTSNKGEESMKRRQEPRKGIRSQITPRKGPGHKKAQHARKGRRAGSRKETFFGAFWIHILAFGAKFCTLVPDFSTS